MSDLWQVRAVSDGMASVLCQEEVESDPALKARYGQYVALYEEQLRILIDEGQRG